MQSASGCERTIRIVGGVAALIAGGFFIYRSFWFHRNFDALLRIPFVFGSFLIGLFIAGIGLRLLLTRWR